MAQLADIKKFHTLVVFCLTNMKLFPLPWLSVKSWANLAYDVSKTIIGYLTFYMGYWNF